MRQPEARLTVHPSWGRRLIGFEGLRAIAALSVVFRHVGQYTFSGSMGFVDWLSLQANNGLILFFALSGFLLFRPYAVSIIQARPLPSVRNYAVNRALRIWPPYLAIFVITCLVFPAAFTHGDPAINPQSSIGRITDPWAILANLFVAQTYVPGMILSGIGPAWSLTTELAFYAVLPLLAWGTRALVRKIGTGAVWIAPVLLVAVGILSRVLVYQWTQAATTPEAAVQVSWGQSGMTVWARSFFAQADYFAFGMIAALIVAFFDARATTGRAVKVGLLVLALGAAGLGTYPGLSGDAFAVASAAVIVAVALPSHAPDRRGNLLARTLDWVVLRYLGLISYSVYLFHVPVIFWLKTHGLPQTTTPAGLIGYAIGIAALVVVCASITYLVVERPSMALKARVRRA